MYVCDVRGMMKSQGRQDRKSEIQEVQRRDHPKGSPGHDRHHQEGEAGQAARPHQESTGIKEFDIVWVMRWFMRDSQGDDFATTRSGLKNF
jgi:hypothetical protein